jgi:ribose transport system ATP-binding protein
MNGAHALPASASGVDPLVSIRNLSKSYPGTQALSDVSFSILPGEIHALAGQNGAGKSTLIRILAGVEPQDDGTIFFRGRALQPGERKLPINFIHQDHALVESLTVAENLALATGYTRRRGLIDWKALTGKAKAALERVGCHVDPERPVGELTTAERSIVALARATILRADLIVLDEPTAALPANDVETLFDVVRRLRAEGVSVLYVTHRLDEIFELADRVTVLRDGAVAMSSPVAELSSDDLVRAITGRQSGQLFPSRKAPGRKVVLSLDQVFVEFFGPVSFEAYEGEILALVGLRGAGHESFGRAIFGALPYERGSLQIFGKERPRTLRRAVNSGIGFASGRRAQESVAGTLAVRENLFLNPEWVGTAGLDFKARERKRAGELVREYRVWPPDPERQVANLSGGNQQKVVLARWGNVRSRLLILEEPTAGVDIGARSELYQVIAELCAGGRTCIVVSSDFDEVAGLAHRALVFDRGRIVSELEGAELSSENLSLAASGGYQMSEDV